MDYSDLTIKQGILGSWLNPREQPNVLVCIHQFYPIHPIPPTHVRFPAHIKHRLSDPKFDMAHLWQTIFRHLEQA
jgi:hypothetical protein